VSIKFKTHHDCEGFLGGIISLLESKPDTLISSATEFSACMKSSPAQLHCIYFDQSNNTLQVFSDSKLTSDVAYVFSYTTEFKGTDSSGVIQRATSSSSKFQVNFLADTFTDFSSISSKKEDPIFYPAPELVYNTTCNQTIKLPELYSAQ